MPPWPATANVDRGQPTSQPLGRDCAVEGETSGKLGGRGQRRARQTCQLFWSCGAYLLTAFCCLRLSLSTKLKPWRRDHESMEEMAAWTGSESSQVTHEARSGQILSPFVNYSQHGLATNRNRALTPSGGKAELMHRQVTLNCHN